MIVAPIYDCSLRFPRRGGGYDDPSHSGLGYVNANNERGYEGTHYGGRPRSQHTFKFRVDYESANIILMGGVRFCSDYVIAGQKSFVVPLDTARKGDEGITAKRPKGCKAMIASSYLRAK